MHSELTLRWRPLDGAGLEHCQITQTDEAITARSVVIGAHEGTAYGLRYELLLDPDWTFRTLHVETTGGNEMVLQSDARGQWIDGHNRHLTELDGCIDIDISGTPLTNTLPIRRSRLVPGEPQRFLMAWLPLDTLVPFADAQIYTLLADGCYRYQAEDGSFEAVIEFGEDGFVQNYPGLFERV